MKSEHHRNVRRRAVVVVGLAVDATEASWTRTRVRVDEIPALCAVLTRQRRALVHVLLAPVPSEACQTVARERAQTVDTGASVHTFICNKFKRL